MRNELLVAARTTRRLTAGQLAELVAGQVETNTGKRPPIDADHIGRMERGLITWPGGDYRRALREVLNSTDAGLGFYSRRSSTPLRRDTPVLPLSDGRHLLAMTSAAAVGALEDRLLAPQIKPPSTICSADVADLHGLIDGMERVDHAAGGRTLARTTALQQLQWAERTLRTATFRTARVKTDWYSAVARLGRLAGFMSVDAREHDTARRCFLFALQVAAEAGDWSSRLNVLSGLARQAIHLGDNTVAFQIAQLARAGEADVSPTAAAVVRVLEGRAYGAMGRRDEAIRAVGQAEELFSRRDPSADPPWLWFYDDAQLWGDTGQALHPLALAGHDDVDAAERLRRAVDLHLPTDTRGRTFSLVKLATLQAHRGEDCAPAVREATAAVAAIRSGRAQDYLCELEHVLRTSSTPDADMLASEVHDAIEPPLAG